MQVDLAFHAPHGRKHGAAFAESWTTHGGTTVVAVGRVLAGGDPIAVGDLLHRGARALVSSRRQLPSALAALDKTVANHARERRDPELAAALALLAFIPGEHELWSACAGQQLHVAIVDGRGDVTPIHGRAGALGTGVEPDDIVESHPLHRDDTVVAATVALATEWRAAGAGSAAALLAASGEAEAAAAVIKPGGT